jgi:LEA14-like dessication related protein
MRLKAAMVAAVVLAGSACAGIGRGGFREPVVTFQNVRVGGLGLTGGTLDIVLSVYNPNSFKLEASRMTYKLLVDTLPFGSGALDTRFSVPSHDSTQVVLPLHFNWNGVNAAGRRVLDSGTVPYRVTGDLTVGSSVGDFTVRFDRAGTFNSLSGSSR